MKEKKGYRIEADSLGEKYVPEKAYYGVQTVRAEENFPITKTPIHKELVKALALTKKATSLANKKTNCISAKIADAMVQACEEIIAGKFDSEFITDAIQGGAGTSMNMNVNEVISNRAAEILGLPMGVYDVIHPNDHANYGQSTNDVVPTAGKIAVINLTKELLLKLEKLKNELLKKAERYSECIKMGRTHLQDAIPISFGQQFKAFAECIKRDIDRIQFALTGMYTTNMGATAVGTGLNADIDYVKNIVPIMNEVTGLEFLQADDLVDSTRNVESFVWLSSSLKTLAVNMSKNSNDIRLMASGPKAGFYELILPKLQPGSSIMPGKVNPVIPEVMNQICFQVFGNDLIITKAAEAGQLELNVFFPVLIRNLLESIEILTNGVNQFTEMALKDIVINEDVCKKYVNESAGVVTAFAPYIGYKQSTEVVKEALNNNRPIHEVILEKGLLSKEEIDIILNVKNMTTPGISGQDKLKNKLL